MENVALEYTENVYWEIVNLKRMLKWFGVFRGLLLRELMDQSKMHLEYLSESEKAQETFPVFGGNDL